VSRKILKLHPDDNVGIALVDLAAGEVVMLEKMSIEMQGVIRKGHKVALININAMQKVYRSGMAIGSATQRIAAGEHVHLHNLKSDYLKSISEHHTKRTTSR